MVKQVRYSDADLQEFKSLIENKLDKARAELKYLYEQIIGPQGSGKSTNGDYFDYSSRHTEMEMLNKMASRQRMFIRNLENALLRIKNKSYGICNITGQLIRKERLLLVPHATKSVAGKQNAPGKQQTHSSKPSSAPPTKKTEKEEDDQPNHSTDKITSSKDEEDKDIEFLQIPRDLLDIDLKDYLDFGEL